MPDLIPYLGLDNTRVMIFVDGENFAIRYKTLLTRYGLEDTNRTWFEPDVYVWAQQLNKPGGAGGVVRKHYYTSVQGDDPSLIQLADRLKEIGIEAPRVFKKQKGARSKRVDISLATEMLTHASRKHFDIAVLVAGDEDYVPLVDAVQAEGCRVHLWFFTEGLSPVLKRTADHFFNVEEILLGRVHQDRSRG